MGLYLRGITLPKTAVPALELIELPPPHTVVVPLSPHIGAPAEPLVGPGDTVRAGEQIASPATDTSLPVHASLAGVVTGITQVTDFRGQTVDAVVIQGNGTGDTAPPPEALPSGSPHEIFDRIQGAGLISSGPHPVPLARELMPAEAPRTHLSLSGRGVKRPIDTLLINALDPEPCLGANRFLAHRAGESLKTGVDALMTITGAHRVVVAIDRHAPPAPALVALADQDEDEATRIVALNARRYPIGLAVPLIKAALGREVPLPYGHPRDVGVAACELTTVMAVGEAMGGLPQVAVYLTVGGGALARQGIVRVPVGTTVGTLIEMLGGLITDPAKLITGGLMSGFAHHDLGVPLTAQVRGLFALTEDEATLVGDYRECINCGRCVKACPVRLVPGVLSLYCARDRFREAAAQGLLTCIECGCCDYVCPARRPMVHLFRHAKHQLMEEER
jgi:electron transport complex protein RnfC